MILLQVVDWKRGAVKTIKEFPSITAKILLFTLAQMIWAVRKTLIEDFGMSEVKANMAILITVDAEKQLHEANKQD